VRLATLFSTHKIRDTGASKKLRCYKIKLTVDIVDSTIQEKRKYKDLEIKSVCKDLVLG